MFNLGTSITFIIFTLASLVLLGLLGFVIYIIRDEIRERLKSRFRSWHTFALQNNLNFKSRTTMLSNNARITGTYRGYKLTLDALYRDHDLSVANLRPRHEQLYTHMALYSDKSSTKTILQENKIADDVQIDRESIENALLPIDIQETIKGDIYTFKGYTFKKGQEMVYEHDGIEADIKYLQFLLDVLKHLLETYPSVVALGGGAVPFLQSIAKHNRVLHHIANQLLYDIGQETEQRLKKQASHLLCPSCFIHCGAHRAGIPGMRPFIYYGCRACGQSRDFLNSNHFRLVAILDSNLSDVQNQRDSILQVNWLHHRQLFDFDEVQITHATDEDVERFAVQVGNDTDPVRKSRYKQMTCTIAPDCELSENTMRILRQTFGNVEVKAIQVQIQ